MTSIVLDTHVLIWYIFDSARLSPMALTSLENAVSNQGKIQVSAISIIEITYLVEKGRIAAEVLARVIEAINNPAVNIFLVLVDLNISQMMQQIDRQIVPEMPDRIIAATALYLGLPLVSCDLKIQALSNLQTIW